MSAKITKTDYYGWELFEYPDGTAECHCEDLLCGILNPKQTEEEERFLFGSKEEALAELERDLTEQGIKKEPNWKRVNVY